MNRPTPTGPPPSHSGPSQGPDRTTHSDARPDLNLAAGEQDRLLGFIRRNMGPKLRALFEPEDILQDTLLSAHQSPGGFAPRRDEPDGGVVQWLHTIALHRIWNLSRSQRHRVRPRSHTGLPPALMQYQGENLEALAQPCERNNPLRELMAPELQAQTLRAIRELDEDRRLSLVLRGLIGTSWPTVTFLTGRKRESARKLHQRCTQSLRERFLP